MNVILYYLLVFFCFLRFEGYQEKDPDPKQIVDDVKTKFKKIQDFTADVEIEINVEFINIPNKSAQIIYKYPDKFKFKSKSFIMIPKKGLGFSVFELLEDEYSTIYIGKKEMNGKTLEEIKVIPLTNKSDIVLATFLIDAAKNLIYQIEATTKNSGYFITDFEYGKNVPLPELNRIHFEVDEMRLPLKLMGSVNVDKSKMMENEIGEVIIRYSNYVINQGLSDDQFAEEKLEY